MIAEQHSLLLQSGFLGVFGEARLISQQGQNQAEAITWNAGDAGSWMISPKKKVVQQALSTNRVFQNMMLCEYRNSGNTNTGMMRVAYSSPRGTTRDSGTPGPIHRPTCDQVWRHVPSTGDDTQKYDPLVMTNIAMV